MDFLTYWLDYQAGVAYCLVRAPHPEVVVAAHREAHGNLPTTVLGVTEDQVRAFIGWSPARGWPEAEAPATRTIVVTDIVGSTTLFDRLGDSGAMEVLRRHNRLVRTLLARHRGGEVKHTGDGFMLSFVAPSDALAFALDVQQTLPKELGTDAVSLRVGITAGEPVTEDGDLFGAAVTLAHRLCEAARPGGIYVADVVRGLVRGKVFHFRLVGEQTVKGFSEPVMVYEVAPPAES